MNKEEYYQVAWSIRDHQPNEESGTVAERLLWNRIVNSLSHTAAANCSDPVKTQWFVEIANNQRQSWRDERPASTSTVRLR